MEILTIRDPRSGPELVDFLRTGSLAPSWHRAASAVRDGLDAHGAVLLRGTRLADLAPTSARAAAAAFATMMGEPSVHGAAATDPVWDVRPDAELDAVGGSANVSLSVGPCEFHTDAAHRERVEPIVALWCYRAAADGGNPLIADLGDVVAVLERSGEGREALVELRTTEVDMGVGPALILGRCPRVRYRPFLIERTLREDPGEETEVLRRAVARFDLAVRSVATEVDWGPSDALFVDNHRVIHARTSFSDPRRWLLRTRSHGPCSCAP